MDVSTWNYNFLLKEQSLLKKVLISNKVVVFTLLTVNKNACRHRCCMGKLIEFILTLLNNQKHGNLNVSFQRLNIC